MPPYTARVIDTHCHLAFPELHADLDAVLARATAARVDETPTPVDRFITIATTPADAHTCVELAQRHDPIFATVGVHPHHATQVPTQPDQRAAFHEHQRQLAEHPKVVAWGEMGLDYHYREPDPATQQRALRHQLSLVVDDPHARPCVIHNREATDDTLAILRDSAIDPARFVFHCFTGTADELDAILDFGATVGFTGIVTFNSARDLADASDRVPLDRLLVETDAPYLTPAPHRKVRPNEPAYVPCVAAFLAQRRDLAPPEFIAAVDANAQRLFKLPALT